MPDLKIQTKFLNGVYKVFAKMFTDDIVFRPLSEADSTVNVYKEGLVKAYGSPIRLAGKEVITVSDGDTPIEGNTIKVKFDFPYKTFLLNGIDMSFENHHAICQGIIEYNSKVYEIQKITPKTFVAGIFLFYSFDCIEKVSAYA